MLVEVNHPPTACEPHELNPSKLMELLKPEFVCEGLDVYKRAATGIYDSIQADQKVSNPETAVDVGYMSSRFRRLTTDTVIFSPRRYRLGMQIVRGKPEHG